MREGVEDFPGMTISFSQPIACRIDELVAGTRAQLIIKLFGEDLTSSKTGRGDRRHSRRDPGRDRHQRREGRGTTYITVRPDRGRIARLGLNVEDVQSVVEMAVGGRRSPRSMRETNISTCRSATRGRGGIPWRRSGPSSSALRAVPASL